MLITFAYGTFKPNYLVKEKLKVENVDSIDDIINSEEWQSFFETIKNDPENAPYLCHHYCGSCTEST